MATVADYTDPYLETFVPVLPAQPGVCDVCHSAPNPGFLRCKSCATTVSQVTRPVTRVVPISLCVAYSQLHDLLRKYKDASVVLQDRLRPRAAALLGRFLQEHRHCLGEWDVLTTVPSGSGREGLHPLSRAIAMLGEFRRQLVHVLEPGRIPEGDRHLNAADDRFRVRTSVDGTHALLVDDMFTTGAAVQSAASALQLAGAQAIAAVVLGRYVKPDFLTQEF